MRQKVLTWIGKISQWRECTCDTQMVGLGVAHLPGTKVHAFLLSYVCSLTLPLFTEVHACPGRRVMYGGVRVLSPSLLASLLALEHNCAEKKQGAGHWAACRCQRYCACLNQQRLFNSTPCTIQMWQSCCRIDRLASLEEGPALRMPALHRVATP